VPKESLVRLVKERSGGLRFDPAGTAPGRGAYVHPSAACITGAARRGGLARAFRVRLDPSEGARLMEELFEVAGVSG
jgi:predicted RNA-binding protein YlxR (DUF448 family)